MDPGIDLLLLGDAARRFDRVTEVRSYGAGIPAPEAANTPIRYKISWTFEGVLRSYLRPASLVQDGRVVHLPETAQFAPEHSHAVAVNEVGVLEAFPNGDAVTYLDLLGIDPRQVRHAGRYDAVPRPLRLWRTMVELHLLDEEPVFVDGVASIDGASGQPSNRTAVCAGERDLGILRVEVAGERGGIASRIVHEVIDRLDPGTGLRDESAGGFTAGAGAQMIARGDIVGPTALALDRRAVCTLMDALAARGITVTTTETLARAA
jgi:saccharopine dehydrogenase-like NADP-dependent oxidoreductase